MTGSKIQPPAGTKQQPHSLEEIDMGKVPDSKQALLEHHVNEILSRDPDNMYWSVSELKKKGLITTPEAVAAIISTGCGLDNLTRQNLETGVIAIYATYISSPPGRMSDAMRELSGFIYDFPDNFSPEDKALLRHLTQRLKNASPLATSSMALSHLSRAETLLSSDPVAPLSDKDERIERFEKIANKLEAVVDPQNDASTVIRSHSVSASPTLNDYLVAIVATNLPRGRGALLEGVALLERINPPLSRTLRDSGGHIEWPRG